MCRCTGGDSAFSSPFKSSTNFTSTPVRKPLPPVPAFNSLYNTPRHLNNDLDDSSAGETPKSPERSDNDATPDHSRPGLRGALNNREASTLPTMAGAERGSPSKEKSRPDASRRDSWLGDTYEKFKRKFNSPGRSDSRRSDQSGAVEKRRSKRHREQVLQRNVSKRRRHSISDSGEDSELFVKSPRKTSGRHKGDDMHVPEQRHWLSRTFTFISEHPTVPHILSFYAQLLFNIFLLAGCVYLIYCFWSAVQGDIDKKSHEAMADIMAEMAECARQYTTNNCDPSVRVPALTNVCEGWSKCMNRDASKVGRAKVSAHTFAEIFNSFVEPISWKAMAFTFMLVFGCFASGNLAFGFFRDKANQGGQYQPQYYQPPPPTPQRIPSGQQQFFGTPWHNYQQLEPGPSGVPQQDQLMIEGGQRSPQRGQMSPTRRKLVYDQN